MWMRRIIAWYCFPWISTTHDEMLLVSNSTFECPLPFTLVKPMFLCLLLISCFHDLFRIYFSLEDLISLSLIFFVNSLFSLNSLGFLNWNMSCILWSGDEMKQNIILCRVTIIEPSNVSTNIFCGLLLCCWIHLEIFLMIFIGWRQLNIQGYL